MSLTKERRLSTQLLIAGAKAYVAEMQAKGFTREDFRVGLEALLDGRDPEEAMQANYDARHAPRMNGDFLVRLSPTDWWKAVSLTDGKATGKWIAGAIAASSLEGEWLGPLPADHIDWIEANTDHSGRLFRTPHFDPWN